MAKKKIKYNQTQFLDCIDKLEHRKPINTETDYVDAINLLYSIINGELSLDQQGLIDLDMCLLYKLENLINDYIYPYRTQASNGEKLFEELIMINVLKDNVSNVKLTQQMATDFDFF